MLKNCRDGWHPLLCLAGNFGFCATIFIFRYLQLSHFGLLPLWNCGWSPLLFRCYTFCCLSHVLPFNPPPPPSAPSSSSSFYLELGASAAISRASAGRPTSQMRGCWLFKSSPDIPISHTYYSNPVSTF